MFPVSPTGDCFEKTLAVENGYTALQCVFRKPNSVPLVACHRVPFVDGYAKGIAVFAFLRLFSLASVYRKEMTGVSLASFFPSPYKGYLEAIDNAGSLVEDVENERWSLSTIVIQANTAHTNMAVLSYLVGNPANAWIPYGVGQGPSREFIQIPIKT